MSNNLLITRFAALPATLRAAVWMSVAAMCYAGSIAIGRHLAPDIPVLQIAFLRNAIAALLMLPWLLRHGPAVMRTSQIRRHLLRGAVSSVNVTLLFAAVALIPIADMSAINFLQPLIGAALAGLLLGEVIGVKRWLAISLGLCGAMVVIRPGFTEISLGMAYALGSAFMGAVVSILIKTMVRKDPPDSVAAWLFVIQSGILLIPAAFVWTNPSPAQWALFVLIGAVSLVLHRTYNRGLQATDIAIAMPFNFTRLIWAAVLGWLMFAELPDAWTWLGGSIIFAAAWWLTRLGHDRAKLGPPLTPP